MANYNDLNIKQKALLLRHLQKAGLLQGIEPGNMIPTVAEMYNKFSAGGDTKDNEEHRDSVNSDDSVVRRFNGADITYNDYQKMQADLIRKKAVDIALSRTSGVAPHDASGNPLASCIFTFGDSYRQAGEYPDVQAWSNYKFNLDPSAYGFVANGPVENTIEGDMYQFMTPDGTPTHATMITGYRGDTPLITESQGHAERPFASPLLSRAEFIAQRSNGNPFGVDTSGTYEEYVNAYNKQKAAWENEYKKNVGVLAGGEGMYETYRYIGTPKMRSDWKSQYDTLPRTITRIQPLPTIVDKARTNNMFAEGGPEKVEGESKPYFDSYNSIVESIANPDRQFFLNLPETSRTESALLDYSVPGIKESLVANSVNTKPSYRELLGLRELDENRINADKYYSQFITDKNTPKYIVTNNETGNRYFTTTDLTKYDMPGFTVAPGYEVFKRNRKGYDYIGGSKYETRRKVADRIPGFYDLIKEKASLYGIDPNLMYHRISEEGLLDQAADKYNNFSTKEEQKTFFDDESNYYFGDNFSSLGMDTSGSNLYSGKYELKNPVEWEMGEAVNEHGETVYPAQTKNLADALEVFAAEMAYRQNEMRKRGIPEEDINVYTNAAWNLGLNHKDLNNRDFVMRKYGNIQNVFAEGGPAEKRIPNNPEQYRQEQRDAVIANALSNSYARKIPAVPFYEKKITPAETLRVADRITVDSVFNNLDLYKDFPQQIEYANAAKKRLEEDNYKDKIELMPTPSCINTALSDYGKQYAVPGNQTFLANTDKGISGFMRIPGTDVKAGDIVQDTKGNVPVHGMIYVGNDENGEPIYNYSNGGYSEIDMIKNGHYPFKENNPFYYRFVGTPEDNERWTKDWMQKHKAQLQLQPLEPIVDRARPLNSFAEGGNLFLRRGTKITAPVNTLLKDYKNT